VETTDSFTGTPQFGFLSLNFPRILFFAVTWRPKLLTICLEGSDRKWQHWPLAVQVLKFRIPTYEPVSCQRTDFYMYFGNLIIFTFLALYINLHCYPKNIPLHHFFTIFAPKSEFGCVKSLCFGEIKKLQLITYHILLLEVSYFYSSNITYFTVLTFTFL